MVLSECTVGQVAARVVTTVMIPSVEQTDTTWAALGQVPTLGAARDHVGAPGGAQLTYHILRFEEAAFGSRRLDLQSFGISQKKVKCSVKV